jgi:hypothetical protein
MKNLARLLGFGFLGLSALSFNSNAQNKVFLKEDYQKYYLDYYLADLNEDSIHEVIVMDYDLNRNGKRDVRSLYLITGKEELNNDKVLYRTKNNACMVILDSDEDGEDDELLIDMDLDGILDKHKFLKKIKKPSDILL